jgi:hypothetical protein
MHLGVPAGAVEQWNEHTPELPTMRQLAPRTQSLAFVHGVPGILVPADAHSGPWVVR